MFAGDDYFNTYEKKGYAVRPNIKIIFSNKQDFSCKRSTSTCKLLV